MPGRAAAASMAERAALEGLISHAATASSLDRSGSASPTCWLSLINSTELTT